MNKKKSILIPAMLSILSVAVFSGTALSPLGPFTFSTMQISLATFGLSSFWGLGRFISNLNKDIKEEEKTNTQKKIKSKNNNNQRSNKKKKEGAKQKVNTTQKQQPVKNHNLESSNVENEVAYKGADGKVKKVSIIKTKGNEIVYKGATGNIKKAKIIKTKENEVAYKGADGKIRKATIIKVNTLSKNKYSYNKTNDRTSRTERDTNYKSRCKIK
jgi:hypothetical protein